MKVNRIKITRNSGAISVDGTATNITIIGFSRGKIENFGGFQKNMLEIKFTAPSIKFMGKYNAKASVLGIPLSGIGDFTLNFSKFNIKFQTKKNWIILFSNFQKTLTLNSYLNYYELNRMKKNILKLRAFKSITK